MRTLPEMRTDTVLQAVQAVGCVSKRTHFETIRFSFQKLRNEMRTLRYVQALVRRVTYTYGLSC
jgi:hypothetical protein